MIKFIKKLFSKKPTVVTLPPVEKRGVIARKVSTLFVISLVHTGDDRFEINTIGRHTLTGTGVMRRGEHRAREYFDFMCNTHGAK